MQPEKRDLELIDPPMKQGDHLLIGAGAIILGYAIGSGRLEWLGKSILNLARNLATLATTYATQAFKEQNPKLFDSTLIQQR